MSRNDYMAKYMLKRYHLRRDAALAQLGGVCVQCDSKENLEFDHKNPKDKSFSVGKSFASMSEEKLQKELSKCQLLCRVCHEEKSITDAGKQRWKHGTLSGYRYCKCELCRKAKSDYSKQRKLKAIR